jgi:hypothetical protein
VPVPARPPEAVPVAAWPERVPPVAWPSPEQAWALEPVAAERPEPAALPLSPGEERELVQVPLLPAERLRAPVPERARPWLEPARVPVRARAWPEPVLVRPARP